ncbi:MAG TPA: hypothetical protein PK299_15985 [Anaerolineales bacterium]|nr:hypothetical protein [Anaerolineales bacterium]
MTEFTGGTVSTGVAPFDTLDATESDNIVRTLDYVEFRYTYTTDSAGAGNNLYIRATLPNCATSNPAPCTPASYTGGINYGNIAKWDAIPSVCLNPVFPPTVPTAQQSGMSADRQTMTCYLGNSNTAQTQSVDFRAITIGLPNGTIFNFPQTELYSDTITTPLAPTEDLDLPLGQDDITVVAQPKWDLVKLYVYTHLRGVFTPGSGPNGEDGFVLPFRLLIRYTGSPKGLEPLTNGDIVINDVLTGMPPYVRLMNWTTGTYNALDGCANHTGDTGPTPSTAPTVVANGGSCVAVQPGGPGTPVTVTLSGVDSTLNHIPTSVAGYASNVFNPTLFHSSNNAFYVAAKYITFWAPLDQVPVGLTPATNTYAALTALSVTGQNNVEPTLVNNTVTPYLEKAIVGTFTKDGLSLCMGTPSSCTAPGALFNSSTSNIVSPFQYFRWSISYTNLSPYDQTNVLICDKFDNTRQDLADMNLFWGTGKPYGAYSTYTLYPAGLAAIVTNVTTPYLMSNIVVELGVGGTNGVGQSWSSYDYSTLGNIIANPNLSTSLKAESEAALATCDDNQSTNGVWYSSVANLQLAGYSLSDVTKYRVKLLNPLPPNGTITINSMSWVLDKFRYDILDMGVGTATMSRTAGSSTDELNVSNMAYVQADDLAPTNHRYYVADFQTIAHDFDAEMDKTADNYAYDSLLIAGDIIKYRLAPRWVTSGANYTNTVVIRDALPPQLSYIPNSAKIDGVPTTPTIIPNSPIAGYTELVFTLPNQVIPYYNTRATA